MSLSTPTGSTPIGLRRRESPFVRGLSGKGGVLLFYLIAISGAEAVVLADPMWGIISHSALLVALLVHSSALGAQVADTPVEHERARIGRLVVALALAPLIRILSLSMPLARFPQIYWYLVIAIPLWVATWTMARLLGLSAKEVGLSRGNVWLQIPIALTGFGFGLVEYLILATRPLIASLDWEGIWLPALILVVATGFTEEVIFRGVLQRVALDVAGSWGMVYTSLIFAALHIGYLSAADLAFVFAVAMFFAVATKKTGSLLGVGLSHGIINILIFLVLPLLPSPVFPALW